MSANREDGGSRPEGGAAFLLAQLGAHAAARFAERIAGLDLTPAQAGVLRLLAGAPGRSQRELADQLGMPPSRFVSFADELEERGLIERRRNPSDRRLHALHLTDAGVTLLSELREVATAHEQQTCQALTPDEHKQLRALLHRLAAQQGLSPGIHPGYRWIKPDRMPRSRVQLPPEESPTPGQSGTD
ncbi:MarR family winged helix-turn-helix transcriptional regulator [Streptomyces sp. NPDC050560]|uniref:MarR family winged helix-turn-helix transcriptional regulator n=1 Tax=Streptomyces sp. NPDC050560 TaxID=3365630 RepID=UPI0037A355EB